MILRIFPLGFILCIFLAGCPASRRVVLYCAQDKEFADQVLDDFTGQSGWKVTPHYDNEANKSVSLVDDLLREARQPRCDVYWNNEVLGTIRLQRQGILEPYESAAAKAFPPDVRAKDHTWTGFASRARVLVLNTKRLREKGIPEADWPRSLLDLTNERWKGEVALSKPIAGTSATQAAFLFQAWGKDKALKWYRDLKANNVRLVPGNKQAAEGAGQGQYLVGITDTDDAIGEVAAGRPVQIVFPDKDAEPGSGLGTIFIPNTVMLIKGCPDPEGARKLIDYLLSPEVEKRLAEGGSRQIPLNPNVQATLPPQLQPARSAHRLTVDYEKAADLWDEVQTFMREEFLR
jgi:iron(III) transport system substrate-binding protein